MKRVIGLVIGVLALTAAAANGATLTVCASGCAYTDPQAAIDAARYGDTILLRAGQTFVAHLVLRAKSGTGWIDIRSDAADSVLPTASQRLIPSDRPGGTTPRSALARIIGRGGAYKTSALLRAEPGAHNYRIRFLEFDGTSHLGYETLVQLGDDSTAARPYDIVLDRVYVRGHPTKGQKRGIAMNGVRLSVLNSYIVDIKAVNGDSQGINGYNGAGPMLIENNHIEAAAENILFGGGVPMVSGLVPSDITIRRNYIYKPLSWRSEILNRPGTPRAGTHTSGSLASGTHYFKVVALMDTGTRTAISLPSLELAVTTTSGRAVALSWSGVTGADRYRIYRGRTAGAQTVYRETTSASTSFTYTGASELAGTPPTSGTKWVVKNVIELKNAERVLIDGNIIENIWQSGQFGYALVLTPRNAEDKAPWTRVRDVTITGNIIRNAGGVINVSGYDDSGVSLRTERITLRNNLFHDINKFGGSAKVFLLGNGPSAVVIDSNTIIHTNSSVLYPYGSLSMPSLRYTNNLSLHNTYGIMGESSSTGIPTITKFFPSGVVTCNVLAGGRASLYPTPNAFPTTADWSASFQDPASGNYQLRAGSPLSQILCGGRTPGVSYAVLNAALGGTAAPVDTTTPPADPEPEPEPAPGNQPPVARPGGPYSGAVGADVMVSGATSSDPDGSIAQYRWTWGDEVLVRAADLPATAIRGTEWIRESMSTAAGGSALRNPNRNASKRDPAHSSPASYVEFQVRVAAGVPYRFWIRMNALGDSYSNDSLHVQFSGAADADGASIGRIGTTSSLEMVLEEGNGAGVSGWGWNDANYGGLAEPIYFTTSGLQTVRIQQREDGIAWDQFILSSGEYSTAAPGSVRNNTTIVPADFGTDTGGTTSHRYSRSGVYPLLLTVVDNEGAWAVGSTTVTVGSGAEPDPDAVPVAVVAGGPYSAAVGAAVTLDGSGSTAPDGEVSEYRWAWADDVLVRAADLPASALRGTAWVHEASPSAAGGAALRNSNMNVSKRSTAAANPASYVEFRVNVAAGVPYRLWMRSNAEEDSYSNDSLYVQFSGALDGRGAAVARIGTTSALPVFLEEGSGAGLSGWGWNDADYGGLAAPIYFAAPGLQTVRIQQREDGIAWDQLVLASSVYYSSAPGDVQDDDTVVPVTLGTSEGPTGSHTYLKAGVYPVQLTVLDSSGGSAMDITNVTVGGGS